MEFTKQVTELFLNGGKIVHSEKWLCTTILIRMPKDEFIQDIRTGQEDNKFEYVYCQNLGSENVLTICGYKSGSLSDVRKRTIEEHKEFSHSVWLANKRKAERKEEENK